MNIACTIVKLSISAKITVLLKKKKTIHTLAVVHKKQFVFDPQQCQMLISIIYALFNCK